MEDVCIQIKLELVEFDQDKATTGEKVQGRMIKAIKAPHQSFGNIFFLQDTNLQWGMMGYQFLDQTF